MASIETRNICPVEQPADLNLTSSPVKIILSPHRARVYAFASDPARRWSSREMARELGISSKTVTSILNWMIQRFGSSEDLGRAIKAGLVGLPPHMITDQN